MVASLQSLARLIIQHKQKRDYPAVLSLWSQLFHSYKKAPELGCYFSVLYACSQVRTSLAAAICEEVYAATWQDKLLQQNVVLATSVMRTLQQCKHPAKALELWDQLTTTEGKRDLTRLKWDRVTFICVLSACADVGHAALSIGASVHAAVTPNELRHDSRLFASLLNMYVKCGQPASALQLATDTWSSQNGIFGDKFVYTCVLTACVMVGHSALMLARRIHQAISSSSIGFDVKLFGVLASMYHICGSFDDVLDLWWSAEGRKLADEDACSIVLLTCEHSASNAAMAVCESVHARIRERSNTAGGRLHVQLISAYLKGARLDLVLSAWQELVKTGGTVNDVTHLHVLSACSTLATSDAMEVAQKLYSQCVSGREQLYDAMLKVFIRCQRPHHALELWCNEIQPRFNEIRPPSSPSKRTVVLVLQACAAATNLDVATSLHSSVISTSTELQHDIVAITSLMNTYTQCNHPALALSVWKAAREVVTFDNIGFTCALQACAQLGGIPDVIRAVEEVVKESQLVHPDQHLLTAIMNVYIKCGTPERGLQYFFSVTEQDTSLLNCVTATTALTACADIGSEDALAAGERIRSKIASFEHDIMYENACMALYTRCGYPRAALQIWEAICRHGTPSTVSYVCAITACAASGPSELHTGQRIHSQIPEQMQRDNIVVSALIAMYLRCGQPFEALKLWKELLQNRVAHSSHIYKCASYMCNYWNTCITCCWRRSSHVNIK
jgi:PPR repeat